MWPRHWRDSIPALLSAQSWDIVVIGGGITGAGILLEAARSGLKVLLIEQRDFAWGTSSRSSKLVHGGLRYLKEGKLHLTRDSVREREHLMRAAAGLVVPQSFAFGTYRGRKPGRRLFEFGLMLYDMMAGRREPHHYGRDEFNMLAPHIDLDGLEGGLCYTDAKTDDARLVMRVIEEAVAAGGTALNYVGATRLLRHEDRVTGVAVHDAVSGERFEVRANVVISATGAWADGLRDRPVVQQKLRPLRGSHLLFPSWRLPVAQAIGFMHPKDGRPVFAFPWEGVTLVGTTDIDHRGDMRQEAAISEDELNYLLDAVAFQFPQLAITREDVTSTYAGVRPVIDTGKADPSKEGRDHAVWLENGLLTVTGGKLTTFRLIAVDALKRAAEMLPHWHAQLQPHSIFNSTALLPYHADAGLGTLQRERLEGRYGRHALELIRAAHGGELQTIAGTDTLWAELRWAARNEAVMHLDDLLLRRTRLGLLVRDGAARLLQRVRAICQPELGWSDKRWEMEQRNYLSLWQRHYGLPGRDDARPAHQTLAA